MNQRLLMGLALSALLLLSGCGESTAGSDQKMWPGTKPLTWPEYVEQVTPLREANTDRRYYRPAMPNMTRWEDDDFLPNDYLAASHRHRCELPKAERKEFMEAVAGSTESSAWDTIEHYAEKGVVFAQTGFGAYCTAKLAGRHGITAKKALEWSRRAAASGDPDAMFNLAFCLERRIQATEERYTQSFLADEAIYWYWRAAQGLRSMALSALGRFPGQEYYDYGYAEPGEIDENDVQTYRWFFLRDLTRALHGDRAPLSKMGLGVDHFATNARMSQEELQRAKRLAREWLLTYPDALPGYVERTDRRDCKLDYALNGKPLNFESLNHQLERIGLHYDPETGELRDVSGG